MSEHWFSDEDLEDYFDDGALQRGRRYWSQGAVLDCQLDPVGQGWLLTARVQGSERRPYELQANWRRSREGHLELDNQCSCPLDGDCKHVVAALLMARAEALGTSASRGAPAPRSMPNPAAVTLAEAREQLLQLTTRQGLQLRSSTLPPPVANRLPEALDHWLFKVANASQTRTDSDSAALIYELGHEIDGGHSGLRVLQGRRLKTGGYGKAKPYGDNSLRNALSYPQACVRADDMPILRLLNALPYHGINYGQSGTYSYITTYRLHGSSGARLLALLLATGRCWWRDHGAGLPLRDAPPRPGHWQWQALDDGSQRLSLQAEPAAAVIATAPPCYVDAAAGLAGEIHSGLPEALAGALAEAPAVAAEHAALVAERLATHTPVERVPLPTAESIEVRRDVVPVPILLLYGEEARLGYGAGRGARLAAAQVWFDYQGERLRPQDSRLAITRRRDGAVWRIERHKAEEDRRLAELKRLTPLRGVPVCFHAWEISRIEPRDLSIPRPKEQELGWREFQEQDAVKLSERGWRIEYDPAFPFRYAQVQDWYGELHEDASEGEAYQQDWFGLELGVMVDGERVNLLPILIELLRRDPQGLAFKGKQVPRETSLALADGRRLLLPTARLAPLVATLLELVGDRPLANGQLRMSRLDAARLLDIEAENPELRARWLGGEKLLALGRRLADFRGIAEVEPPAGLKASLRPYQREGLNWLQFLRAENLAGILADDMGLGKTVQALAHLLLEKEQGRLTAPALIVAPTSLMGNWRREAEKFTPGLSVLTLHGAERKGQHARIGEYDLVLTTYALLRFDHQLLAEREYSWLLLDEAQHIKNAASATAKLARTLKAERRLSLTGTPLENHLGELWSQFHFLLPGLLGSDKEFKRLYRNPIEKHGDSERGRRLQRRVAPFLLRRTKQQVATELPAKTEILRSVVLEGAQRDLYETVRLVMNEKLRAEIARQGLERSQIVMLDALLKLRQVCCDPRLVKLAAAKKAAEQSAKLELLMELLADLLAEGRKVLLFSQFTSMLELIEPRLAAQGIAYAKLTGETRKRDAEVARFQTGEVPLFLLSLKAGGVGLNLTAADAVIHYDPWWNPAAENQATDRAHRIGQDKPVFVYRLIVEGSVEERIQALQAKKAALFAGVVGDGEGELAAKFTVDDLAELFRPLD